ncbi:hypothetical protein NEOLI_000092 [Neolecta irregularis DAH-3]|uniref:Velvet domain-containing protein n=1 Tax=Neolecta irregularis (strain DAH-3) TaxID=1198029 RepID=A0A1U7LVD9_NEOID|nr:hypothetical protein NEOLI_000092 [Neolecta irregularis DAH-3]|eukprot:OLL26640.1 hypothetical protein NEOLI_000092 [Neolecta irregularis DAH-3]
MSSQRTSGGRTRRQHQEVPTRRRSLRLNPSPTRTPAQPSLPATILPSQEAEAAHAPVRRSRREAAEREAEHSEPTTRRRRNSRSAVMATERARVYILEIVTQPEGAFLTAHSNTYSNLGPLPMVLRLRVRDSRTGEEIAAEDDHPYLVAHVSLWDEEGEEMISPPNQTLFRGSLVASPQIFRDYRDATEFATFFIFQSLQVSQIGNWRLSVGLVGLWPAAIVPRRSARRISAESPRTGGDFARVFGRVLNIGPQFTNSEAYQQTDSEIARFLDDLRSQGASINSPPRGGNSSSSVRQSNSSDTGQSNG